MRLIYRAMAGQDGCFRSSNLPKVTQVSTTLIKPKQASKTSESVKLGGLDHVNSPLLVSNAIEFSF